MSRAPLAPLRKRQLELYIAGCVRVERRIKRAARCLNGGFFADGLPPAEGRLTEHIRISMRRVGHAPYTSAMMNLHVARSRFQCELDGREYAG